MRPMRTPSQVVSFFKSQDCLVYLIRNVELLIITRLLKLAYESFKIFKILQGHLCLDPGTFPPVSRNFPESLLLCFVPLPSFWLSSYKCPTERPTFLSPSSRSHPFLVSPLSESKPSDLASRRNPRTKPDSVSPPFGRPLPEPPYDINFELSSSLMSISIPELAAVMGVDYPQRVFKQD